MIAIQSDGRDLNLQLQQNVTVQSFDSLQISTYQIVFFKRNLKLCSLFIPIHNTVLLFKMKIKHFEVGCNATKHEII